MSMIISIPDGLRQSVEAASGARNTVLYDDKGYPSVMVVVPRFNIEDVLANAGTGTHPAFIVNGTQKAEIFVGKYQGVVHDGRLLSLPGQNPGRSFNYDQARQYCSDKGTGWHLMTNAEWAAVALWCHKNGFMPRGNNNYARDATQTWETGRRISGGAPGDSTGDGATLTGSGPMSWNHDNTAAGISDLNGNVWEWSAGMRLVDGEIQIIPDNDAGVAYADMGASSPLWKAIRLTDGALVAPGSAGTAKWDMTTSSGGVTVLADSIQNVSNGTVNSSGAFEGTGLRGVAAAPNLLRVLGLHPGAVGLGSDVLYARNVGERLPVRGGNWSRGGGAGVFALSCNAVRSDAGSDIGARPAFVL